MAWATKLLPLLILAHASAFSTVKVTPTKALLGGGAIGKCSKPILKGALGAGMDWNRALRSTSRRYSEGVALQEHLFEKDVIEFSLSEEISSLVEEATRIPGCNGATSMLGAVVEVEGPTVQALCVREKGSSELYADSRLDPFLISQSDVLRVIDTFPGQRPVPSLGGGVGYGAEGVDCWELQEAIGEGCLLPVEDTGMGFHQKGW